MPKTPSSRPVKRPAAKTGVKKTTKKAAKKAVKKVAAKKTVAKKSVSAKAAPEKSVKRPRATVLNEHPGNLVADPHDHAAIEAMKKAETKTERPARVRKRTPADRAADPLPGETGAASMIARVSDATGPSASGARPSACALTHSAPARVLPAPRPPTRSHVSHGRPFGASIGGI